MKTENEMIELVKSTGFLPLFYHQDPEISVDIIKALYTAGVRCVEYTNRGASALNNFKIILENNNENEKITKEIYFLINKSQSHLYKNT